METEIVLYWAFPSRHDSPVTTLTFQEIADSFMEGEYFETFKNGWPFIRALVCHLAYELNVSFSDEERETIYDNVWPLVKEKL